MATPNRAPEGNYDPTGEVRAPREGEFYLDELTGKVLIADYGRSEKRQIMKQSKEQKLPATTSDKKDDSFVGYKELAQAARSASELLRKYLSGETIAIEKIRTAAQTLQIYAKLRAVETADKALLYAIIKDVSGNKEELKKLVGANVRQLEE